VVAGGGEEKPLSVANSKILDGSRNGEDADPLETAEWLDSLDYVLESKGPNRVTYLLSVLDDVAYRQGVELPFAANTPYINSIPVEQQPPYPGSREIERRIKSIIRWNAMAMVVRANKQHPGIGGHISTYASAATLYEVGFNHFFRGRGADGFYRRSNLFPGARFARHLCPCVPGRPSERAAVGELPRGAGPWRRTFQLSAPLADAQFLGVSHGVDGPGADHGHLPGAV
jgi:hypothetical protein